MPAKKKHPASDSPGSAWKRIALLSVLVNVALAAALLWSRAAPDAEKEAVSRFVDTYFRTWSEQDMQGYENCFHPDAVIYFLDGGGTAHGSALAPFIDSQRQVHANAKVPMREIPTKKEIDIDGNVARALVRWKLFNESGEEVGTDYFTLLKTKTGWKIINLIFRKDG